MCINVEDVSLVDRDRFSLIVKSRDVVPALELLLPSLAPQRTNFLSDIAADQTLSTGSVSL